jgi:hypothetical protein
VIELHTNLQQIKNGIVIANWATENQTQCRVRYAKPGKIQPPIAYAIAERLDTLVLWSGPANSIALKKIGCSEFEIFSSGRIEINTNP